MSRFRFASLVTAVALIATGCFSPHHHQYAAPPPAIDAGTPAATSQTGRLAGSLQVTETVGASAQAFSAESPSSDPIKPPAREQLADLRTQLRHDKTLRRPTGTPTTAPAAAEEIAGELIIRFERGELSADEALKLVHLDGYLLEHGGYASSFLHLIKVSHADGRPLSLPETRELAQVLRARPGIRFIELNRRAHALAIPNDPLYPLQWHYPLMNLPAAWDLGQGSSNIVVADIDTGVINHPDLAPNLLPGIDLISDPGIANDGNGRDLDPTDRGGDEPNGQSSWHGTHTAGTIAAVSDNNLGLAGVAPKVRLVPVRALGVGGGTDFDITAGIVWAAGGNVPGAPLNQNPARVINMSLGGSAPPSRVYQDAIDFAVSKGAVVIVAAGNDDEDSSNTSPCNQDKVICVGAVGADGRITAYSNYGAPVDVMAPGGDSSADLGGDGYPDGVLSTYADSSGAPIYQFKQGTSMATPHVSGLVALMLSANPSLTAARVESLLKATANSTYRCNLGCGTGLVDAYAAVSAAKGQTSNASPELAVSTTSATLRPGDSFVLGVSNIGGQTLNVTATPGGELGDRIELEGSNTLSVAAGKSSGFVVSVISEGLGEGDHTGSLKLTSNGGSVTVTVTLRLSTAMSEKPAVVAAAYKNAQGDWKVADAQLSDPSHDHAWALNVPPGTYFLLATVDSDGDGDYFEQGEPLGFYRSMQSPEAVTVSAGQGLDGLNFAVLPQSAPPSTGPAIGDACSSSASCPGGAFCADNWPGGYCSQSCDDDACPDGSLCVTLEDQASFCLAPCNDPGAQSSCRPGYTCAPLDNEQGGACLPTE